MARERPVATIHPGRGMIDAAVAWPVASFRDALVHAARTRDAALRRVSARSAPSSNRIFPALVEGRFSLVDQWDTDGTRHVVVIDNPEKRVEPRALTSSELRIARGLLDGKSVKELAHAFVTRTEPRPRLP